jgi:type IV secretory pathway VirB2 component (pilin)
MELAFLTLLAILLLVPAGYVHRRIASFTQGTGKVIATRSFLLLVAIGFGWVVSFGLGGWERVLLFLAGFGLVHVPAAAILFIKSRRGSGPS